jgi:hypothetical protein
MLRIDATFDGKEYTFRTNDSGAYLFVGVGENRQISCDSGFNSLRRIKKAIREHLRFNCNLECQGVSGHGYPRIKFAPGPGEWKA